MAKLSSIIEKAKQFPLEALIFFIGVYRECFSTLFIPACRFYPSCATYAQIAFREKGLWMGLKLSLWRLLRCHPFHAGGYDPVK
jgi:putative membrane protein insertion efficiency factor